MFVEATLAKNKCDSNNGSQNNVFFMFVRGVESACVVSPRSRRQADGPDCFFSLRDGTKMQIDASDAADNGQTTPRAVFSNDCSSYIRTYIP